MAEDIEGHVWTCGEATAEYEDGMPVNTDGSFQADVDGARPGTSTKAAPAVGDVIARNSPWAKPRTAARVVSLHGSATTPGASRQGDRLVTRETTALEPDAKEKKSTSPGVGEILTIDLETGERTRLIEIIDGP